MAQRGPTTEWLRRRTVWVFGLVVFGYLALGAAKLIFENYRVHEDAKRLQSDLEQVQQHNTELRNLLAYYRTDAYKEKEARARLGFQKPGERVIAVPLTNPDEATSITQPGVETQPATPPSNPRQWWNYFFGRNG